MNELLNRHEFNRKVKERDENCILCGNKGMDAHHILERKLFEDGGYYLENGAFVCYECHWDCELTLIHPRQLYDEIGIEVPKLPKCLDIDHQFSYDKWGNIITSETDKYGRDIFVKGPMFETEQFQKILNEHMDMDVRYQRKYVSETEFYGE